MTATTLSAFLAVNLSPRKRTDARKAKRQLVDDRMVLLVTLVRASDLVRRFVEVCPCQGATQR
jgi:hypothetical protein